MFITQFLVLHDVKTIPPPQDMAQRSARVFLDALSLPLVRALGCPVYSSVWRSPWSSVLQLLR